jgi:transcriptional regulator of acetoin/glycerol metabolism
MLSLREKMVRARAALKRGGGIPNDLISEATWSSWQRCFKANLDPETEPAVDSISANELQNLRDELFNLRRFAAASMKNLYRQICGSQVMIALSDENGVVLDLLADREFELSKAGQAVTPGSIWSEAARGTNGIGTCAVTKSPIMILGHEHYYYSHSNVNCTAHPIFHTDGRLAGVLVATTLSRERQQHTMALVAMAATQIENSLFADEQKNNKILMFYAPDELMNSYTSGLIGVNNLGHVTASNKRSRELLLSHSFTLGTTFDELFNTSFDKVVTYLQDGSHAFITDKLGIRYQARWLNPKIQKMARIPALNIMPIQDFIADDLILVRQLATIKKGSHLKIPVLITGETGTGKEMMAHYIHNVSQRQGKLVPVNCGAIAKNLIEAELFGYEAGAFTGAKKGGSTGLICAADGGTVFFDEIVDLSMNAQVALLRFLDSGEIRRVGGHQVLHADVQVITASNLNLLQAVKDGRFREDLYYRINVLEVQIPPIRERTDFPLLVQHLLGTISSSVSISDDAVEKLSTAPWPGNMRELKSALTRIVLSTDKSHITCAAVNDFFTDSPAGFSRPISHLLSSKKIDNIRETVDKHKGNVSKAARSLGISRTTVYKHLAMLKPEDE